MDATKGLIGATIALLLGGGCTIESASLDDLACRQGEARPGSRCVDGFWVASPFGEGLDMLPDAAGDLSEPLKDMASDLRPDTDLSLDLSPDAAEMDRQCDEAFIAAQCEEVACGLPDLLAQACPLATCPPDRCAPGERCVDMRCLAACFDDSERGEADDQELCIEIAALGAGAKRERLDRVRARRRARAPALL